MTTKDEINETIISNMKLAVMGGWPEVFSTTGAGQLATLPVHTSEQLAFSLPW